MPPALLRLTLSRKIFLALATMLVVLLITFAAFSILGLQRGLGSYVAEIEIGRMDSLAQRLARHHAAQGNWDRLRGDPGLWERLLLGTADGVDTGSPVPADPRLPPWYAPRAPTVGTGPRPDPLLHLSLPPPPFPLPGGPWTDMPPRPPQVLRRLALLDASGAHVAGAALDAAAAARLPLRENNRLVGYLALAPVEALHSEAHRAFLARQRWLMATTGLVGLLLALAMSWWLARRWLGPIDELAQAARMIARGRLHARVPAHGSDELAALGRTFNAMAARLDRIETQRRAWLADVSHELRTPLAAMRAEIEALQDGVRSFDDRTALRLHRQVMRLGQLVDDLRSSMQGGEAELRERAPVYPLAVLREALAAMRERYAQVRLAIDAQALDALAAQQPAPMLEGDARRLHQAFMNLLENTLRYTDPGGQLTVGAHIEDGGEPRLVLSFDDTAPAAAPDELPRLFERLYRGEASRSRESGGSGLGLSICRAIVEAHGGFIDAQPSALGGLCITLALPLAAT
ncbi:ATP-binding protein [Xenophilus azovorans]|uniref:ATP-binding protein n=1 Tax=Xenophilus azovorans TaxID=151755 RepID=UPI000AC78B6A|nr:ATP-binding protein [Xenophilus azovorans]